MPRRARTWASLRCLVLGALGALLGCAPTAPPAQVAPTAVVTPDAPGAPTVAELLEESVHIAPVAYRFRASRFANLLYTIDCLSQLDGCTREAFEELASQALGGLDAEDRAALARWNELHERYRGFIDGTKPAPLPSPNRHRAQLARKLRCAGFGAADRLVYAERLAVLYEPAEVAEALQLLARFEPRFARHWAKVVPELESQVRQFAAALREPKLRELAARIEAFYGASLPNPTDLTFELVWRPHSAASRAEQLGPVSLIEVMAGEPARERLAVVMHELFHYYFSEVEPAKLEPMVARFASDAEPLAYGAYGALNEGLACALGNGMVGAILEPRQVEEKLARPLGMYRDAVIDRVCKVALAPNAAGQAPLELAMRQGLQVSDPAFSAAWMELVRAAFPRGPSARMLVRPALLAAAPQFRAALEVFGAQHNAQGPFGTSSLQLSEARELLESYPRWTRVLLVSSQELAVLNEWSAVVSPEQTKAVRALARTHRAFAFAAARPPEATVLVLVAPDAETMRALLLAFLELEVVPAGLALSLPGPSLSR